MVDDTNDAYLDVVDESKFNRTSTNSGRTTASVCRKEKAQMQQMHWLHSDLPDLRALKI